MASSSSKKIAQTNKQKLYELHSISATVVLLCAAIVWFFKRPSSIKPFLFFQLPLIGCQYVIESSCRPKYKYDSVGDYDKLVSSGHDMNQSGLTEYMTDVIYFTWILDITVVALGSNKVWYLLLIIPGYAAFKLSGFIKGFFPSKQQQPEQASLDPQKPEGKSKRQQKLEKNGRRKILR
ncbi:hypothetical protein CANTEDRAFT_106021 [Yamadazyma tenuis ATCC 10573]|uniref:DUF788-domain-containing protein n=1 Tax=Candida tenuis (strain ATCC 10573 / BCRC 21748 / CBS 615 / JCM 9827 / NBRC 10315 / NRRL Y-1498 / VKM Y-70) TaxID=590646 RepID=G3B5Q2_CANTC|nr:uncharacterized protein CANTEDRAFT_106021 [Yamadazyma tenuis ATCC 10573]EGV63281.1 hypothetical protein CANTEDRAFT_106021 [Yamadazyma tenuis ATCC 10573]